MWMRGSMVPTETRTRGAPSAPLTGSGRPPKPTPESARWPRDAAATSSLPRRTFQSNRSECTEEGARRHGNGSPFAARCLPHTPRETATSRCDRNSTWHRSADRFARMPRPVAHHSPSAQGVFHARACRQTRSASTAAQRKTSTRTREARARRITLDRPTAPMAIRRRRSARSIRGGSRHPLYSPSQTAS